jgi:hypothetical protein
VIEKNYYEILEVRNFASTEVIKGAYKYLAQRWHPDKNPNDTENASEMSAALVDEPSSMPICVISLKLPPRALPLTPPNHIKLITPPNHIKLILQLDLSRNAKMKSLKNLNTIRPSASRPGRLNPHLAGGVSISIYTLCYFVYGWHFILTGQGQVGLSQ